jgi:hypothetical protein
MRTKGSKNKFPREDKGMRRKILPIQKCGLSTCSNFVNVERYDRYVSFKEWTTKRHFCSRKCFALSKVGRKYSPESIRKSVETRRKLGHYWNNPESIETLWFSEK